MSRLRRNGLALATGLLAAAAIIAGLAGNIPGAIAGLIAVLVTVGLQVRATESGNADQKLRAARAISELGQAARRYHRAIATGPSYGGTSVFEKGEFSFELERLANGINEKRFNFLEGHRQDQWASLGAALRSGRIDFVAHAGTVDGLPAEDLAGARALGDIGESAARRAYAVASAYAGFNVDAPQTSARWAGADQEVDLAMLTVYADLGEDLAELASGLKRMIAFAPRDDGLAEFMNPAPTSKSGR